MSFLQADMKNMSLTRIVINSLPKTWEPAMFTASTVHFTPRDKSYLHCDDRSNARHGRCFLLQQPGKYPFQKAVLPQTKKSTHNYKVQGYSLTSY